MKQQKNTVDSRMSNQKKKVFQQKKSNIKKPLKTKQEIQLQAINQSTLNDTIDQFVNTTDMNLDNIIDKSQIIPFSPTNGENMNNNLNDMSNMSNSINDQVIQIRNNMKINQINKQDIIDDYDLVQSRDYKNITISTPSIIDQKHSVFNRTLSSLSHQTTQQIKIGNKQINDKKNSNVKNVLNNNLLTQVRNSQDKKQPSKKNSISQNQFKEEDEYSYEEEAGDDEYEYEEEDEQEDNQQEEQKNQNLERIIIDQLVTLDPNKNQIINIDSSKVNNSLDAINLQKKASSQQSVKANRKLQLDINSQGQMISISPTFGNGNKNQNSTFKELAKNQNNSIYDIENQDKQSSNKQSIQSLKTTQAVRIQSNNQQIPQQIVDINNKKKINNSRKVNPLILPQQSQINQSQQSQSPNSRVIQQFNPENLQMYNNIPINNQNGNVRISNNQINDNQNMKFLNSYNSFTRGPTPARQHTSQVSQQDHKEVIQIRSIRQQSNPQIPQENEQFHCKICLETECTKDTGKMITPCKCSGTLRNVHEECLKTWIITQQKEIMDAQCEVCMKEYEQHITFGLKFNCANTYKDGKMNCLTSIVIFLFLIALAIVIGLLFKRNEDIKKQRSIGTKSDSFLDNSTHVISLISICFVIFAILLIIIYFTLKEACFVLVVKDWMIEQYTPSPQFENSQQVERTIYQNVTNTEYNQNIYQSIQNQQIITYEQFLRERRSMPTVIGTNAQGNNLQNNNRPNIQTLNQSRNSPKSRVSQAQSCVTQMQQNNKQKLTQQQKIIQINKLFQSRKKFNKPIVFNQKIFFSSRRQSQNDPIRVSQPFI